MTRRTASIAPYTVGTGRLITARSFLIDRIVPACETSMLPSRQLVGGTLTVERRRTVTSAALSESRLRRLGQQLTRGRRQVTDRLVMDLRVQSPANFAHFLNYHIPLVFRVCDELDIDPAEVLAIVPARSPAYLGEIAELFGIDVMQTNDSVDAECLTFDVEPWEATRCRRFEWVGTQRVAEALGRATDTGTDLPKSV